VILVHARVLRVVETQSIGHDKTSSIIVCRTASPRLEIDQGMIDLPIIDLRHRRS